MLSMLVPHTFFFRLRVWMLLSSFLTESQNHRMVGVGRDLCGSSSPTLLPNSRDRSLLGLRKDSARRGLISDRHCWSEGSHADESAEGQIHSMLEEGPETGERDLWLVLFCGDGERRSDDVSTHLQRCCAIA